MNIDKAVQAIRDTAEKESKKLLAKQDKPMGEFEEWFLSLDSDFGAEDLSIMRGKTKYFYTTTRALYELYCKNKELENSMLTYAQAGQALILFDSKYTGQLESELTDRNNANVEISELEKRCRILSKALVAEEQFSRASGDTEGADNLLSILEMKTK